MGLEGLLGGGHPLLGMSLWERHRATVLAYISAEGPRVPFEQEISIAGLWDPLSLLNNKQFAFFTKHIEFIYTSKSVVHKLFSA